MVKNQSTSAAVCQIQSTEKSQHLSKGFQQGDFLAHLSTMCFRVVLCASPTISLNIAQTACQFGLNLAGMLLRRSSLKIVHRI